MDFDFTTETITPDTTNVLTIGGSGGLELSVGTTAERPGSPVNGTIRYNSDLNAIESYENNTWDSLAGVLSVSGTANQVTASGTADITLSTPTTFIAPGSLQYTTNFGYPIESIAATGTNQAGAALISLTTTLITAGTTSTGVILPVASFEGEIHAVTNNTLNIKFVYPNVGSYIDDQSVNEPAFITPNLAITFVWDGIHWVTLQSSISAGNAGISVTHDQGNVLIFNNGVTTFSGGSTGLSPVSATSGAVTLGGTLGIANGGTGATTPQNAFNALSPLTTSGDTLYFNGTNNVRLPIGTSTQVLSVTGGLPAWINQSAIDAGTAVTATSATTATNLAGGALGDIPYQTSAGTTAFLTIGTSSQVLVGGTTPSYVSVSTALGYTPLNKAGDTMSGTLNMGSNYITSLLDPVNNQDAATKSYVDSLSTGLIWQEPVQLVNLVTDTGAVPGSPANADVFIIDTGENINDWSSFAVGDVVQIQDGIWTFIKAAAIGDRYGISFATPTTASGSFTGYDDYITTITGGTPGAWTYSFAAPVGNWATYVINDNAYLVGVAYTYSTDLLQWVQFSSPTSYTAGTGLSLTGRAFNNTGVLSLTTNTGLSTNVSAAGDVTITNTGVTSLTAGAGITLSGSSGAVTVSAVAALTTVNVTANYTFTNSVLTAFADASSGGFTVTLPLTPLDGEIHNTKKTDDTRLAVIVDGNGANIDNYTTVTINVPYTSIAVQWNATTSAWQII